jgi:DNA-binding transcriptional ArsR family regulator
MDAKFSLASTAALIADTGRAAMLTSLLDGRALAAGELARAANVSAQSASMHLGQLLDGGLVKVAQQGRHRYYQIASFEVAHAVEALSVIASPRKQKPAGESRDLLCAYLL